jgi:hypothetical protein
MHTLFQMVSLAGLAELARTIDEKLPQVVDSVARAGR